MNRHMRWLALALLALPAGCGGSEGLANAVIGTTIAVASSGVSRSQGGCYASCPPGTTCDEKTGYCTSLPCRGQCKANEQCVEHGIQSKCVALGLPGETITVQPSQEAKNQP